ncbi:hypothetical protein N7470_002323 [Penicillium chermesinum]|nr:hypothetical protein N7470_002323 [Penicillium chermesinum]
MFAEKSVAPRKETPDARYVLTPPKDIPIVHRVVRTYPELENKTKKVKEITTVRGYIPGVGFVTIMLSEYPWLKTALLGLMGLMVLLQRE